MWQCDRPQVQFIFCAAQLPCHFAYLKFICPSNPFPPLTYHQSHRGSLVASLFHFKFTFNCRFVVAGIKFRVPIFGSIAWKYVNADIFRLSIALEARKKIKPQQKENERLQKREKTKQRRKLSLTSRRPDTLLVI